MRFRERFEHALTDFVRHYAGIELSVGSANGFKLVGLLLHDRLGMRVSTGH